MTQGVKRALASLPSVSSQRYISTHSQDLRWSVKFLIEFMAQLIVCHLSSIPNVVRFLRHMPPSDGAVS